MKSSVQSSTRLQHQSPLIQSSLVAKPTKQNIKTTIMILLLYFKLHTLIDISPLEEMPDYI